MHKIISAALLAMAVLVPAFAMDSDKETRMESAKKECAPCKTSTCKSVAPWRMSAKAR